MIKVSVIIPCHNSQRTLSKSLKSVLKQSYKAHEILVYDDASTDNSLSILREFESKYDYVHVFSGVTNVGAGLARSYLLNRVSGEYVAFLDSDDVWDEKKLEKQVNILSDTSCDICVCGYYIYEESRKVGSRMPPKNIDKTLMQFANWIPMSMAIVRADLVNAKRMPPVRLRQDYAYWLKIFQAQKNVKCVTIREFLGIYNRTGANISGNNYSNVFATYRMFRDVMHFSVFSSLLRVFSLSLVRIFRS